MQNSQFWHPIKKSSDMGRNQENRDHNQEGKKSIQRKRSDNDRLRTTEQVL